MSRSPEDLIKIFGMTNQIIESDLDRIEREFKIDLGRHQTQGEDRDPQYYPQFEEAIRIEASRMREHYEVFYCLEKSIRSLIAETLRAEVGTKWWNSGRIPPNIHEEVVKRIKRDIDSGTTLRSSEEIDFTNFGELGEIIKTNWDLFGSIFNSKSAIEKIMANLNTLRGPIAHCSPLVEDEVLRLQLSLKDWFRQME